MTQNQPSIPLSVFTERLAREVGRHAEDLADFERNFEGITLAVDVPSMPEPWHFTTLQALDQAVQTSRTLAALTAIIAQACAEGANAVPIVRLDELPLGSVRARMTGIQSSLDIPASEFFV